MYAFGVHFSDLWASVVVGIIGYLLTSWLIPALSRMFIAKNLYGIDLCKTSKNKM